MAKDLRKAAKHVSYEIEMLMFAGSQLGGWHSSPMSKPAGNYENMALECFLLHFRNLRSFLCPTLQMTCGDDICASAFLGKAEAIDVVDKKTLARDIQRLNKMLAHLSYTREPFIEARKHAWPVARMSIEILEKLEVFLDLLNPEMRSWFQSNEQISNRKSQASSFLEDPIRAEVGNAGTTSVVIMTTPPAQTEDPGVAARNAAPDEKVARSERDPK